MVIQAHRLMHEDGGIGDDRARRAAHGFGDPRAAVRDRRLPRRRPGVRAPAPDTWSRPETSGGGYGQAQLTHLLGISLWLTDLRGQDVFALMSAPLDAKVELHDAIAMRYDERRHRHDERRSPATSVRPTTGTPSRSGSSARAGMFHLDLRDDILWRYRGPDDDRRVRARTGRGPLRLRRPDRRAGRRRSRPAGRQQLAGGARCPDRGDPRPPPTGARPAAGSSRSGRAGADHRVVRPGRLGPGRCGRRHGRPGDVGRRDHDRLGSAAADQALEQESRRVLADAHAVARDRGDRRVVDPGERDVVAGDQRDVLAETQPAVR